MGFTAALLLCGIEAGGQKGLEESSSALHKKRSNRIGERGNTHEKTMAENRLCPAGDADGSLGSGRVGAGTNS